MSYVSRKELRRAYEDCIKHKRGTTNAINFEVDDNVKLENLYVELNMMTYTIGSSIVFVLRDEQGIPRREVFAADFRDRIVHHLLINRLIKKLDMYHFDIECYACRKEKGTLYGATRCKEQLAEASQNGTVKELYIMKGDFHNCFNTFNKDLVYQEMEKFVIKHFPNDKQTIFNLWLLKMIIYHCPQHEGNYRMLQPKQIIDRLDVEKSLLHRDDLHGIAIGNLTSQTFANFFLTLLDKYIREVLGYKYYGRYIDDFFLIHTDKEKLKHDYKLIIKFAQSIDLEINEKKFYLQHYKKGVRFVGFFVYYDRLQILNPTKYRLYKAVYDMERVVRRRFGNDRQISKTTAERFQATWNSYMGIISHTTSQCVIKRIIHLHPWLFEKLKEVYIFTRPYCYVKLRPEIK